MSTCGARPESTAQGHAGELPFLFDQLGAQYGGAVTPQDKATAQAFNTYVANFVKTGDPNSAGLPAWPQFDDGGYDLLHFSPTGPVFERDPRADRMGLIESARARE
jgi:para-nitrobenzyl esterase